MSLRVIGCLFGIHRKKWVAIFDYHAPAENSYKQCPHGWYDWKHYCCVCKNSVQIARWTCGICVKMGERVIKRGDGLYKIEYGYLVPDEERWGKPE